MHYLATIKVLVEADSPAEACDLLSEMLRPAVVDWTYLGQDMPISQYMVDPDYPGAPMLATPSEVEIGKDYEEGDLSRLGDVKTYFP